MKLKIGHRALYIRHLSELLSELRYDDEFETLIFPEYGWCFMGDHDYVDYHNIIRVDIFKGNLLRIIYGQEETI